MNRVSHGLFQLLICGGLLAACERDDGQGDGELTAPPDNAISHFADNSFEVNTIGARFIPVLDDAENVALGARFDTLTGQIIGASPCIAETAEADRGNQYFNMRLVEVADNYSQMKALDIDVSVQGSYMGATANAKASFASSQKFTQQTQKFLLYAKAERKPKTVNPASGTLFGLTPAAEKVLDDPVAFRNLCGDAFVVAIFEGIELFGMLNFHGVSQSEQKNIGKSLGGSYGGWSASVSANSTVDNASSKNQVDLKIALGGRCDALSNLGGDTKTRWANMVDAGTKLQSCADAGGNITTFKVVPYSSRYIRGWPHKDEDDPDLNRLLYYYAGYSAVLDSINSLLTDRGNAYRVALLHRGRTLPELQEFASTVRAKRGEIKDMLTGCQSSADAANRPAACQNDVQLETWVSDLVHPYVYRAQLPLYFVDEKPAPAFLANGEITTAILRDNVQNPYDVACAFADKAGLSNYAGCPTNYDAIWSQAEAAFKVTDYPWPLETAYMFQTLSTSNNLCMVAPTRGKIVTASACNFSKPASARQRMIWLNSGQLRYSVPSGTSGLCVDERNSAACDSVRATQQWRFVPSQAAPDVGLLQNAAGLCLAHSNRDRNVTYRACNGDLDPRFYQWRPKDVP